MINEIICNRAQCRKCNDIIISHDRHDYVSCTCRAIAVDGGTSYLRRSFKDRNDIIEMSVYSDSPFNIIRESLYRGGRGKDGTEELKYVLLKDMSNQWVKNTIDYNININFSKGNEYYIQELNFRLENDIYIGD